MKRDIINNLKNIVGWRTKRKLVVFCVDDYGNVRLNSAESRQKLEEGGMKLKSRFDKYDALETREDLEVLFNTLSSVTDIHGNPAVFTAFAMPSNLDFESIIQSDFNQCFCERLDITFDKLEALQPASYGGAWKLMKEGIDKGLICPQFHGREHFNKKIIVEKLLARDKELLLNVKNRSLAGISDSGYSTISWTAAFDFWHASENRALINDIHLGMNDFKMVYGFSPICFTPPATVVHDSLLPVLKKEGIKMMDAKTIGKNHQGLGKFTRNYNYTGKTTGNNLKIVVRNVMFEPTMKYHTDWVKAAMEQINAAFRWGKPAVISSHRVNFAGQIDAENRRAGIQSLTLLLKSIKQRWPEVEFITANQLNKIMEDDV